MWHFDMSLCILLLSLETQNIRSVLNNHIISKLLVKALIRLRLCADAGCTNHIVENLMSLLILCLVQVLRCSSVYLLVDSRLSVRIKLIALLNDYILLYACVLGDIRFSVRIKLSALLNA